MTDIAHAIYILSQELRSDSSYWQSWQANIAMFVWGAIRRGGFEDEDRRLQEACNKGAYEFLVALTKLEKKNDHPPI